MRVTYLSSKKTESKCAAGPRTGTCYLLMPVSAKEKTPIKSTYTIGGQALEQVDHHHYLGVELRKNLSWDHQINQTVSKAQKTLNLLRRNITKCSQITKQCANKALVRPTLEYACSVWDPFQANHISKLEAVQPKGARCVRTAQLVDRPASVHFFRIFSGDHCRCGSLSPGVPCSIKWSGSLWHPTLFLAVSFKTTLQQQLSSGAMHIVPPRGHYNRPRLGSTDCSSVAGAVY